MSVKTFANFQLQAVLDLLSYVRYGTSLVRNQFGTEPVFKAIKVYSVLRVCDWYLIGQKQILFSILTNRKTDLEHRILRFYYCNIQKSEMIMSIESYTVFWGKGEISISFINFSLFHQ